MYADDDDNLHIPSQLFFDGYIYFRQKTWDVSVNIQNITNALRRMAYGHAVSGLKNRETLPIDR